MKPPDAGRSRLINRVSETLDLIIRRVWVGLIAQSAGETGAYWALWLVGLDALTRHALGEPLHVTVDLMHHLHWVDVA